MPRQLHTGGKRNPSVVLRGQGQRGKSQPRRHDVASGATADATQTPRYRARGNGEVEAEGELPKTQNKNRTGSLGVHNDGLGYLLLRESNKVCQSVVWAGRNSKVLWTTAVVPLGLGFQVTCVVSPSREGGRCLGQRPCDTPTTLPGPGSWASTALWRGIERKAQAAQGDGSNRVPSR